MKHKKFFLNKKAYFYSLDAFIALTIILTIILVVKPPTIQTSPQMNLQEDLLDVLSSIKVGEIDNSYVKGLISQGKITNLNQSVLEQIGEFYATSDPEASLMTNAILTQLSPQNNIGLYFNNVPISEFAAGGIAFSNARDVWTSRQIISGIQAGQSAKGFSSRAFLSASNKVDYFYFGGYVGDGNITVQIEDQIADVDIEAVFGGPFDLFINSQSIGTYTPTVNTPFKIDLSGHIDKFSSGTNYIDFKTPASGAASNLFIAGGFIKVVHNESADLTTTIKKNFPGIFGLINLYDSFYIPGTLNSMEVFLNYNSNVDLFLVIGDKTVFLGNTGGLNGTETITNVQLSTILDYSQLSRETVPVRLGLLNATYVLNQSGEVDVYSVTDLSGSMNECVINCTDPNATQIKMIDLAIDANKEFKSVILNLVGNRVGLVGYESVAKEEDYHQLSSSETSLDNKIDSWKPGGGTCICCGINRAVQGFLNESDDTKLQSMVVMSDGRANVKCSEQGTGDASQDAIQAACDAFSNHEIVVHAVGFGQNADEETFQSMASCGGGNYYFSDITDLVDIYNQIANDIINASYFEQTIAAENVTTSLYSDSYISLNFTKQIPFGLVINAETPEFGNTISEGDLFLPNDTSAYEVRIISYSGSKWTDNAAVFDSGSSTWEPIFNLSSYGLDYIQIGDPFVVNVPIEKIVPGNNRLRVSTGLSPANSSGGSVHDKILYTFVKNISSFSTIVASAEGCTWNIEFEDGTNTTINVPSDYADQGGTNVCYYNTDQIAYNNNDAINIAIFKLLDSIDLNKNRMIETKFSQQDLELSTSEVQGIPFTWETEVQVRIWR